MLYISKIYNEDFDPAKRCMRLITFSNFQEHATPIFKNFKILKLLDIIKSNYFEGNLFVSQGSITIKNQRYFDYK